MCIKRLRCIGWSFFAVFLFQPAFSQFQISHFTTENGLPSNGIKGLQWDDSTGFLWIATEAGLVRYNGMGFKTFDVKTNPELGSNRIVMLVKNAAGKILMGGQDGNLTLVENNTASLYFKGDRFAKYNYNHYGAVAASDTLFRQCFKTPWPSFDYSVTDTKVMLLHDTAVALFIAKKLYYYTVSTIQPQLVKTAAHNIKSTFQIGRQLYYVDSLGHFFAFDLYNGYPREQEILDTGGKSFPIHSGNSKLLWQAGMETAIFLQQGSAWIIEKKNVLQLRFKLVASGLPENVFFNNAQYNYEGNRLFLSSASKGIYIIHRNQLTIKQSTAKSINQSNSLYSQIELPSGNIITSEGIVIGDASIKYDYGIGKAFYKSVYNLNDSIVMLGYSDSIFSYNKKTFSKRLMFKKHVIQNYALAISGNQLYFADQTGIGIVNSNSIDFLKYFDKNAGVNLSLVNMIEIAPHKLALATCEGLLVFDTETKEIDTLLKLPAICVRTLYKEGDYIFIGTYGGGFYVMKNAVLKAMPLDINQYLKYANCFIKDANGFCWISTNNGLFKAKMSDIIDAYEKNLPQVYYHYLGKNDGMEITEMNGGCTPCAIRLKNDNFSFPTMDGMLWFNPEKTTISLPAGDIFIDKVVVDGNQKYVTNQGPIQLAENVKKIDFSFAVNAWCRKENLYIDYKLNNDKWLKVDMASDEPGLSFSNLSYGTYILTIRKMNGFGVSNYSYSTITFTIATPFYHRWWFRIAGLLALVGIGYLIFQLQLRQYNIRERKLSAMVEQKTMDLNLKNLQLEKNDQIKTRLIAVINHDIITPLKFMHYAGKALVENKGMIDPEQHLETISDITQTAKDMEMLSSQILNWIIYQNPNERMQREEFDLHQLVEMVFGVLQFPAKLKHTQLQNNVPANFVIYQYMEPLRVLIYNLVLNSINFTKEGLVSVKATIEKEKLILVVNDTGLGMTKQQIDNLLSDEKIIASANIYNKKGTGLGYMIIKDLLKMMGGLLFIESSKSNGTEVSVSLDV